MRTVLFIVILVSGCALALAQTEAPTPVAEPSPQAWSSAPMPPPEPAEPTEATPAREPSESTEATNATGASDPSGPSEPSGSPEPSEASEASEPTASAQAADAAEVFDLKTLCLDCHRLGQPRVEAPLLEGQHSDYLRNQLVRFQERHRDSFPMSSVVAGMDQAMLRDLADQLSAREWPALRMSVAEPAVTRGRARAATLACDSCHGAGFMGTGDIPRLAGQHPGYLRRQLADIAAERRYHPPSGIGVPLSRLDEADIADLAAFLHAKGSTPPP